MSRKTSTRAIINLFDTSAKLDGEYETNTILSYCDIDNLDLEEYGTIKYATSEKDVFLLDGSYKLIDNDTTSLDFGYWSGLVSDESGNFNVTPKITREFNDNHTSTGVTLFLDDNYALPLRIKATLFDGNGYVLGTKTITPSSYIEFIEIPSENFRKVELEIIKTNPYSYARIKEIEYGESLYYSSESDRNLATAKLLEELDSTSNELPINTSELKVIDKDERFNILNPDSLYKYLQQRQKIQIFEKVDDEEYQMATHYLKEWQTENDVISIFKCQDIIGLMSTTTFKGNVYNNDSVEDILDEILQDFGLDEYYIQPVLAEKLLTGVIKPCSHREAIQQVMFACCGVADTSRTKGINFYKVSHTTDTLILKNRVFQNPKYSITQGDLVTGVIVSSHSYVKENSLSQIYKANLSSGVYDITFKEPYENISGSNCTIIESSYFWAKIQVESSGEVILEGKKLEDYTSTYQRDMQDLPANAIINRKEVKDATLISKDNAMEVVNFLYEYYQYRLSHELKIILENEKVGNFSTIQSNNLASVVIESLDIDLTGGFLASVKGVGFALSVNEKEFMQLIGDNVYSLYAGSEVLI